MQENLPMRQEFGASQELAIVETASSAVAAQAKAMVESRYIMAMRSPRNMDQVRQDLIRECKRPAFANNKSAFYRKPIGQGVEGLGIRFVEVALRCLKNVLIETSMIFEDPTKEVHRVSVTDLESNVTYPLDVRVSKTVERSRPMDDGSYISMRKNSYGKDVFTVTANDDDLLNKRGALISKAVRTLGLRIIPGDLQDEAEAIIKAVRMDDAAKDPEANRKLLADSFAEIGIRAQHLADYLGHTLETCTPKELVDLRGIYGAIKDGEATWKTVMENKAEQTSETKTEVTADGKPTWDEKKFAEAIKKQVPLVVSGAKSVEELVKWLASKHPLTDAQLEAVKAIEVKQERAPSNDAEPTDGVNLEVMTAEEVAAARQREIEEAKNENR